MAGIPAIACIGPSYPLSDRKASSLRAVNLFMREVEGLGESKQVTLDSSPDLSSYVALGATARGVYSTGSRLFVVAGSSLYEIVSGAAVSRGTLSTSTGRVGMKHGRDQLVIVDGDFGYVFTLGTNAFAQITSAGWRGSYNVAELDGYFIFVDPGTDQFYLSAIDNASSLDALDFSSADAQPDDVLGQVVVKRELFLLGERSMEVWVNSGAPDFPFTRYNSTPIDIGVVGVRSFVRAADTFFFVGQTERGSGTVYEMRGHQPVRVSHRAVEEALSSSTDITACTMWAYQIEGAEFVGVNAPGLGTTWVYDAASKQWHERGALVDGAWTPWPADDIAFHGEHYAISGSALHQLVPGSSIVCERTWPHLIHPSYEPVSYHGLELQCKTGAGGSVTLEISNDGGFTYGPPLARSMGATGRWMERVRWMPLGSARDRVFRLRYVGPGPWAMHGAVLEAG